MDTLDKIKQMQQAWGLSKYELSKRSGLSQSTISNLYRRNNEPTLHTLKQISKVFGVSPAVFVAEEGETVPLTGQQQEMLELFNGLSKENQEILVKIAKVMQAG